MSLLSFDRAHLWHPYTSMTSPLPCYEVVAAEGVRLELADGRRLIDGMASWWCAIHGYRHPVLDAAVTRQLQAMSHVMFGGITHRPAVDLGRQLLEITPERLEHIFFADSGSVAVEVAIKMAMQYQVARGRPEKCRMATVRGGYHGDTTGAMAVTDPEGGMHRLFRGVLPPHFFAARPESRFGAPLDAADIDAMHELLDRNGSEIAAVIIEPVVQGAGGMWFYAPEYLAELRRLCDAQECLLIFDEIATGLGRTGKMFALEHAYTTPDILCVGKALTGGYMTLSAVLASTEVAHGVGTLMHGPTFMANPLACAVALANVQLLRESDWVSRVGRIERGLAAGLAPCASLPTVVDVRVLGAIGVVEMRSPVDVGRMQKRLVEAGVWVRPFRELVYVMPPYVIDESDLAQLCGAISDVVADASLLLDG